MEKRASRHTEEVRPRRRLSLVNLFLLTVFTGLSAYLVFLIFTYNFLDFKFLNYIVCAIIFLTFLVNVILLFRKKGKWFSGIMLFLASLLVGSGIFFARSAIDFSQKLNYTASFSQVDMSVVVVADSPIETIEQVQSLLAPSNDADNLAKLMTRLQEDKQLSPAIESVPAYQTAYEQILADHGKAMVLNSAYVSLLEGVDADFSTKIKTIYTTKVETPKATKESIDNKDAFNIYISGIDSYGPISGISRSDVNIIMTVNRKTKKILLTTTPRDSYVAISGGGNGQYDKLTHAGIYGVDASIGTLENLYGIDITHYARLNFTSFVQLIDLVGGIEVENSQEFTQDGVNFPVGQLHLTAENALRFVRERYGLQGGDADRGKNQMKVITALLKKLASLESLSNYQALIDGLSGSIQTDMPLSTMMDLANDQLSSDSQYQVTSQVVTGYGSTGQLTSYAMPNAALYMVTLDETSLNQAKAAMQAIMEGN